MRIGRSLPPTAAPMTWIDLGHAAAGFVAPRRALRRIEDDIRKYTGAAGVFLVSSGTAALVLALRTLKSISTRREVVLPAYTCFSVAAAALEAGLRPVLCDIEPNTLDYDSRQLERTVSDRTLCVVAHHLYGAPGDIDGVRSICTRHGSFVVEDAAQAMGTRIDGRVAGTIGDLGVFSLARGKNITCGSGGIVIAKSQAAASTVAREYDALPAPSLIDDIMAFACLVLMTIFIRPRLYWIPAALPFLGLGQTVFPRDIRVAKLSGIKAGFLRNWRRRLARANEARATTAAYFKQRLSKSDSSSAHPYLRLPVMAPTASARERIVTRSQRRGLGVGVAYPTSIAEIPQLRNVCEGADFPSARSVAERLLTLPTHEWVSEKDRRAIAELCRDLAAA